jgi:hypothetical protein
MSRGGMDMNKMLQYGCKRRDFYRPFLPSAGVDLGKRLAPGTTK